jgi:P4 family phage/plasmid primase-like protien
MRLTRKNLGNKADKWDWEWEENRIRGMVDDFHKKQANAEAEAKAAGILLSPNKIDWGRKAKAKLWPTLRYWREDYYVFCDGAYKAIDDEVVEAEVTLVLEQAKMKIKGTVVSFDAKKSNVAEAMQALRVTSIIPPDIEAGSWIDGATGPTDVIVFPNGRLDLAVNQLSPPDPRFFATSTLGFDWGEDEPGMPVNFLAFLKQIFDGDQEQINLVLEMIGYCLTTDGSLQKAFLILGPKRSGKGTLLRVIEALLGQNKIHAMPLKKFGQTFGLQGAINKRLILISDARVGGRQDQNAMVENILKITGQDPISIDRKYKDDWFGRLQAKILAMSNIMPKVGDDSGVIATRFVHIQTKVSFFGREDLTLFDEKLKPELPAILHLCIKALKKLRQRGRFLQTIAGAEAQEEMAELSNPIEIFVKEKCVLDQNETIPKDDLYQTYTGWTDENNEFTLPKSQFFAALYASFPDELKVVRPRSPTPGPRPAVIHGIALIQLPPSEDGDGSRLNNLSPADRPQRGRHRTGQGGRGHHRNGQGGEPE